MSDTSGGIFLTRTSLTCCVTVTHRARQSACRSVTKPSLFVWLLACFSRPYCKLITAAQQSVEYRINTKQIPASLKLRLCGAIQIGLSSFFCFYLFIYFLIFWYPR